MVKDPNLFYLVNISGNTLSRDQPQKKNKKDLSKEII